MPMLRCAPSLVCGHGGPAVLPGRLTAQAVPDVLSGFIVFDHLGVFSVLGILPLLATVSALNLERRGAVSALVPGLGEGDGGVAGLGTVCATRVPSSGRSAVLGDKAVAAAGVPGRSVRLRMVGTLRALRDEVADPGAIIDAAIPGSGVSGEVVHEAGMVPGGSGLRADDALRTLAPEGCGAVNAPSVPGSGVVSSGVAGPGVIAAAVPGGRAVGGLEVGRGGVLSLRADDALRTLALRVVGALGTLPLGVTAVLSGVEVLGSLGVV
nr:hypothetical protein [Microbispora rosea]